MVYSTFKIPRDWKDEGIPVNGRMIIGEKVGDLVVSDGPQDASFDSDTESVSNSSESRGFEPSDFYHPGRHDSRDPGVLSDSESSEPVPKPPKKKLISSLLVQGVDTTTPKEGKQCVSCMENSKIVVYNCGHVCYCIKCHNASKATSCPLCRVAITVAIKIFK